MSSDKIQILMIIWGAGLFFAGVACWAVSLGQLQPKSEAEREFDRQVLENFPGRKASFRASHVEEAPFITADREYTKLGVRLRGLAKLFQIAGVGLFAYGFARPFISMLPF